MSPSDAPTSGGAAPYRRHQQVTSSSVRGGGDGGDRDIGRDDDEGRKKQASSKWRRWLVRQRTAAAENRCCSFCCCFFLASFLLSAAIASVLIVQQQQKQHSRNRPSDERRQRGSGTMHLLSRHLWWWDDVDEAPSSATMMPILIRSFASRLAQHVYEDDGTRPLPVVALPPPLTGDDDRSKNATSEVTPGDRRDRGDDVTYDRGKFWDLRIGPIPEPGSPSDPIRRPAGRRIRHEYEEGELYRILQMGKAPARFPNGTLDWATTEKKIGADSHYRPRFADAYLAFDDDEVRAEAMAPRVEHRRCRRTAWHRTHHPSCNIAHEIDFVVDPGVFVGFGAYREVWSVGQGDDEVIAKLISWDRGSFSPDRYEMIRMDAMVMDLLKASPRIVDVYSHCATTVLVEPMWFEVEDEVIHESDMGGYATTPEQLEIIHNSTDVVPQNNYTATEKLNLALDMARCIADVHGYGGGVIVHDDVQIAQFLWDDEGRLTLGDFNRAEVMLWDPEEEKYCKHFNGPGFGNFRSPEEYKPAQLDEKIDVFSYGNIVYCLLTGLWPFYHEEHDEAVHQLLVKGKLPFVDDRYRTRSYAEGKLVEAMERCWRFDPDERADIFEIVDFLELAAAENARMTTEKDSPKPPT